MRNVSVQFDYWKCYEVGVIFRNNEFNSKIIREDNYFPYVFYFLYKSK